MVKNMMIGNFTQKYNCANMTAIFTLYTLTLTCLATQPNDRSCHFNTLIISSKVLKRLLQQASLHSSVASVDVFREAIKEHKESVREKFRCESEGAEEDHTNKQALEKVFTELHAARGARERVDSEHDSCEMEDKARSQTEDAKKNDFRRTPVACVRTSDSDVPLKCINLPR